MYLAFICCVAVGVTTYIAYDESDFSALIESAAPQIGAASSSSGVLKIRRQGSTVWRRLVEGDSVFDGDSILAEVGASYSLKLRGGRTITGKDVGFIQINSVQMSGDRSYDITLSRGDLTAENRCRSCASMFVRTGDKTIEVPAEQSSQLVRSISGEVRIVSAPQQPKTEPSPIPVAPKTTPIELAAKAEVKPTPVAATTPTKAQVVAQTLAPTPTPTAATIETGTIEIASALPESLRILGSLAGASGSIPVQLKATGSLAGASVAVEILDASNGTRGPRLPATPVSAGTYSVNISVGQAARALQATGVSMTFKVRPVLTLRGGAVVVGQPSTPVVVEAVAGAGGGLLVGLQQLAAGNAAGGVISARKVSGPLPNAVWFRRGTDLQKIAPLIAGSGSFSLTPAGSPDPGSYIIIAGGVAIAAANNTSAARVIAKYLGGNLIYKGNISDLADVPVSTPDAAAQKLITLVDQGKTIYFYNGQSLTPVSGTFIKTSGDLPGFIQSQGKLIFTQKVDFVR
jgi:hypothetical protein